MDLSQYGISASDLQSSGNSVNIQGLDGIQNTLSGIQNMLPAITIASLVITALFLVAYILHIIRRWKVDRAIIETHKDIAEIRKLLEQSAPTPPVQLAPAPGTILTETEHAPTHAESESSSATLEHTN